MHLKFKKISVLASAILIAALGVRAQQALEPSAAKLQQHISYLASDALDGRRTGTAGANDAARYIAGEFARAGLRPANNAGNSRKPSAVMARYLQTFGYVGGVELGRSNALSVRNTGSVTNFRVGEDWMPLAFSSNEKIENAEIVIAGYGITSTELNHNDYNGKYTKNQVAVVKAGNPDGDNPHSRFARAGEVRFKVAAARNAGVGALLIIAGEKNLKDDGLSQLRYDNAGEAGIPVIVISQDAASKILAGKGTLTLSTDVLRNEVPAYNVVGVLEGSDPILKNENIIIGAHYDHLGRGGEGSLAPRSGEIHHGADDNASGTAGVIELARLFSAQRPRPKRTLVFIAFSGEEEGLLGSNYYVNHPLVPLTNTVAMINMDMIGRMKDRKLIIGGVGTAKEWRDLLAKDKSFELTLNEDGFGPSDHSSFYGKQVPVLFFWTGTHNDYHKPSDTFDKINYADEARILGMVARIVRDVDSADKRLTYTTAKSDSAQRTAVFRVYLGTIPNYADSSDGLLLDGVRDESPAAQGGLKAGDRIVKIANRDIKNVYDYTYALGEMKAGQEYVFEVIRGSEKVTLKITPEARK